MNPLDILHLYEINNNKIVSEKRVICLVKDHDSFSDESYNIVLDENNKQICLYDFETINVTDEDTLCFDFKYNFKFIKNVLHSIDL